MGTTMKRKTDTRNLVRAGILCALIIVMTFVPYTGYIYYGLIEITTLHIVVAVGAVLLGWQYGAVLGFVWGVTCILRALTNPLWAPFLNPMISLVPRVLVGIVAGLVAGGLKKLKLRTGLVASISAAAATLTNTVLVLSALKLFSTLLTRRAAAWHNLRNSHRRQRRHRADRGDYHRASGRCGGQTARAGAGH